MASNELTSIEGQLFNDLRHLKDLTLSINYIHAIPQDAFNGLGSLEYLNLAENQINHIHPLAFLPLKSLKDLNLAYNKLQHLPTAGLLSLEKLKLFHNPDLREFPPKKELPNVTNFVLTYAYHCCDFTLSRPEQIYLDLIREHYVWMEAGEPGHMAMWARYENETLGSGSSDNSSSSREGSGESWYLPAPGDYAHPRTSSVSNTHVNDYHGQVYDQNYVTAKAAISCKPQPGPFMPCDDLFGWWSLRCGVWFVFMLALVGNGVVFFVSVTSKTKMDVPRFLICNLAVADFFMGIYLGILAIMDASTLGQFKKYAIQWQMSAGCLVAGTLGVLSSELSVFTLTVITLERFYAITHAMQLSKRLSLKHAGIIMFCGWIWSFGLSILPLFGVSDYRKFAVCLPFAIESIVSKSYVCFIMIFNGLCFFIILRCYLLMYISIRDSQAWNSYDTRVAKRMALLVFTDFLCWAPIAFLSLAAAFGKNLIQLDEAKVLTIFILPLNSCANPFLYAFFTKQFKKDCVLLCRRLEDSSLAKHFSQASHRDVSLSWKNQRKHSAFHSLMGDKSSYSQNNSSASSNSFGLLNFYTNNNVRKPGRDVFHFDRYDAAARTVTGFHDNSGCRVKHTHKHKYIACSTCEPPQEVIISYVKAVCAGQRPENNIKESQVFYSQSGAETNNCSLETFIEEDDSLSTNPTGPPHAPGRDWSPPHAPGRDWSPPHAPGRDWSPPKRYDSLPCPSIVIHTDDNSPLDEESIWIKMSSQSSDSVTPKKHRSQDESHTGCYGDSHFSCCGDELAKTNINPKKAEVYASHMEKSSTQAAAANQNCPPVKRRGATKCQLPGSDKDQKKKAMIAECDPPVTCNNSQQTDLPADVSGQDNFVSEFGE